MSILDHYYEVKTPPVALPLNFATASAWCRDIDAADADLVETLIAAATDKLESMTNRVFVTRTITGMFSCFGTSEFERYDFIEVRRSPFASIVTVKVNGVTLDAAEYELKKKHGYHRVLFLGSHTLDAVAYPIEIEFTAGYSTVPGGILVGIQQLVLFWYENRGDVSTDGSMTIPLVVKTIVNQYRIKTAHG